MSDDERRTPNLLQVPAGEAAPDTVNVVVEVPKGASNKYEYDPDLRAFKLDRVLYSPMHYPGEYGFIPSTHAKDGDPLDVLVLSSVPTHPGIVLRARPLGFLEMHDQEEEDQKILAVPVDDPRFTSHDAFDDVATHYLREIEHFFAIYKELENKRVEIGDWRSKADAHALIRDAMGRYEAMV